MMAARVHKQLSDDDGPHPHVIIKLNDQKHARNKDRSVWLVVSHVEASFHARAAFLRQANQLTNRTRQTAEQGR